MANNGTTEKLKKSITIYSALGILIIGIVVSKDNGPQKKPEKISTYT
ncbi:MAG: hypothetical protein V3R54_01560 [Thermodesulfovibrionia bacterium]